MGAHGRAGGLGKSYESGGPIASGLSARYACGVFAMGLLTGLLAAAAPKVGDVAPDFSAVDTDGKSYQLSEMVKAGNVIVAFFPKAFTPG